MPSGVLSLQNLPRQCLTLTPALKQSVALLQLSTADLQERIQNELAANPLLELADTEADCDSDAVSEVSEPSSDDAVCGNYAQEMTDPRWLTWAGAGSGGDDTGPVSEDETLADEITLAEHLEGQLGCCKTSPAVQACARWIIGNLDEEGRLNEPLEQCARQCPVAFDPSDWQQALNLIQSFDPAGCGALDLLDSLQLQIGQLIGQGQTERLPVLECARRLLGECFEDLAHYNEKKLAARLELPPAVIHQAHQLIGSLDLHPGAAFADTRHSGYILAEIVVVATRHGYQAQINPQVVSALRFNHGLYEQLVAAKLSRDSLSAWKEQAQNARFFVYALEQRFSTLVAVAQSIVQTQTAFFCSGVQALRPMVLRDLAQQLGIAESTVSRATAGKYMQTPRGVFELKYFFSSGIASDQGDQLSAIAVRSRIREIVAAEDPAQPVSDAQIVVALQLQGIFLARRTVAKYREIEHLAPRALRRRPS